MTLRSSAVFLFAVTAAASGCAGGSDGASIGDSDGGTTASSPDAGALRDGSSTQFLDTGVSTHSGGDGATPRDAGATSGDSGTPTNGDSGSASGDSGMPTNGDSGSASGDSGMPTNGDSGSAPGDSGTPTNGDSGSTPGDSGMPTNGDSGSAPGDSGMPTNDAAGAVNNVAQLIVDEGPTGVNSSNTPFVTVTVCIPGTTTCQTIDHVIVDTGSSGLHIIASVLSSKLVLPLARASAGSNLAECQAYITSEVWGGVHMADVKIAGETAPAIPIQIIGDPSIPSVPSSCGKGSSVTDTVTSYGGNGLVGINQLVADCGSFCETTPAQPAGYYSCTSTACTPVAVPVANQVSNPIAFFAGDNNGAIVSFASTSAPATGASSLAGSLIFGIGTQSNNSIGSATVLTTDESGNLTTVFNGQSLTGSYFDTGRTSTSFADSSIAQCGANDFWSGSYCPTSTLNLTAVNRGANGATKSTSFAIANADNMSRSDAVLPDIGAPADGNDSFAWGFPFFIGRNVYVALEGASTPGGKGPYYAY